MDIFLNCKAAEVTIPVTRMEYPERVILGLPLYGYAYEVADNEVPTANISTPLSCFSLSASGIVSSVFTVETPSVRTMATLATDIR